MAEEEKSKKIDQEQIMSDIEDIMNNPSHDATLSKLGLDSNAEKVLSKEKKVNNSTSKEELKQTDDSSKDKAEDSAAKDENKDVGPEDNKEGSSEGGSNSNSEENKDDSTEEAKEKPKPRTPILKAPDSIEGLGVNPLEMIALALLASGLVLYCLFGIKEGLTVFCIGVIFTLVYEALFK